jgi:hypothetical protein
VGHRPRERPLHLQRGAPDGLAAGSRSAAPAGDLLLRALEESAAEVGEELRGPGQASRRREAFQLIAYKLEQLRFHLTASRRRLNDLRTLRRMLHGERSPSARAS